MLYFKKGKFTLSKRRFYKKNRQKQKNKKRLLITALLLGLAIAVYSGYVFYEAYQAASKTYDDLDRDKSELREEQVEIKDEPVSILIMGVETYGSGGNNGRADALMLATFNPNDKTAKLVSIPRDTRVQIPGRTYPEKINHAYAYGEEILMIETVEDFLNVPVDYYVTVNFDGFKNIIDTVDGVTVDVPFDFKEKSDDPDEEWLYFEEGPMHLDGRYALAYVRMRYEDPLGDIGRTDRQKQLITSLVDRVISPSTLLKVNEIAENIASNVQTNVKISDGISFLRNYSDFGSGNIESLSFEYTTDYIDNISYVIIEESDAEKVADVLRKHLEIDDMESEKVTQP